MADLIESAKGIVLAQKETFLKRLANSHLNFEAEAGFACQHLESNNYLLSVAMSNQQSLINAVTNVAAIGISLNPARKQAYLVPRDKKVCLDISYIGLVDLATQTGSISWVKAELVFEKDVFEMGAPGQMPLHKFEPFAKDRGAVIGVYCVAKLPTGEYLTDAMSWSEVEGIRNESVAWKSYLKDKSKKCPWVTHPGEMGKKTVVKRAHKLWPHNERLSQAIHHLNIELDEGIDFDNRQSEAKKIAEKSLDERKEKKRHELILKLEEKAKEGGTELFESCYAKLAGAWRELIEDDLGRLRDIAASIDAKDVSND